MTSPIRLHCDRAASLSRPAGTQRSYFGRFARAGAVRQADGAPSDLVLQPGALAQAAAAGLFDSRAVFVDHAGAFQNQSLERLVGVTGQAAWNAAEQSIEGPLRLYDTPLARQLAAILDELLASSQGAPDVGLSIVFYPQIERGADGARLITAITKVESVDLVFQPAADGRILQALSAVRAGTLPASNPHSITELFRRQALRKCLAPATQNSAHVETQDFASLQQLFNQEDPTMEISTEPSTNPNPSLAITRQEAARSLLAASGLPPAAQQRIARQMGAGLRPEPSGPAPDLEALIETERQYLAELAESQVIQIGNQAPRSPQISGARTSLDRIQIALEALLAGTRPAGDVPPLTGIRELYHLLSGDYEMTGLFHHERIQFANVNSATMASLVANALNKVVASEFIQYPHWWEPVVQEQDYTSLQAVKWITLGGIGELPTVAEGAAYTELSWDDNYETASFVKKGGYLGLTMEAIDKDDTGRMRAAPRALAQAAWLTLSKAISSIFTSASGVGPNLADGNALFYARSAGTNVGATALSMTSWNAVKLAMRKFTELNSGERMGALVSPKYLLVPPDLEVTALQVLGAEYDYLYALSNGVAAPPNVNADGDTRMQRLQSARERVIVVDLWTDANDWAAVADPRMWPTIGIGYRYGRQPEIFSVATPTAGLMFTNDTMPVKARFVFAAGPMDWRGLYKMNVA